MCDTCDRVAKLSLTAALREVAKAMQDKRNRGRACLDELVGKLVGEGPNGKDALDHAESLEDRRRS